MGRFTFDTTAFEDRVLMAALAETNALRTATGQPTFASVQAFLSAEFAVRLAPAVATYRAGEKTLAAAKFDALPEGATKDAVRTTLGLA